MDEAAREEIAEELMVEPEELTPDVALEDLEMWDSVTALTIMVILGDVIGRPVEPSAMAKLVTWGDVEALVARGTGS